MTPPQYAKHFPAASPADNTRAAAERLAARIGSAQTVTPPQFATLLQTWRLEKLGGEA